MEVKGQASAAPSVRSNRCFHERSCLLGCFKPFPIRLVGSVCQMMMLGLHLQGVLDLQTCCHPSSGLAGVSSAPRHPQPAAVLCLSLMAVQMFLLLLFPSTDPFCSGTIPVCSWLPAEVCLPDEMKRNTLSLFVLLCRCVSA